MDIESIIELEINYPEIVMC